MKYKIKKKLVITSGVLLTSLTIVPIVASCTLHYQDLKKYHLPVGFRDTQVNLVAKTEASEFLKDIEDKILLPKNENGVQYFFIGARLVPNDPDLIEVIVRVTFDDKETTYSSILSGFLKKEIAIAKRKNREFLELQKKDASSPFKVLPLLSGVSVNEFNIDFVVASKIENFAFKKLEEDVNYRLISLKKLNDKEVQFTIEMSKGVGEAIEKLVYERIAPGFLTDKEAEEKNKKLVADVNNHLSVRVKYPEVLQLSGSEAKKNRENFIIPSKSGYTFEITNIKENVSDLTKLDFEVKISRGEGNRKASYTYITSISGFKI
ncbi:hypothetical protein [Ureaplasma canigenitalium]|uniref:hypothetical protein n=1 Tax=Ureaplasma canigenitalium TaxID=42092 RepID=UPI0004E23678|nr:hypothetical protein [Ureaplasma canigenitalium]